MTDRIVYRSPMSDNRRWDALKLREGDIVISAPSKCGVTWTQRLVSLLVFDGADLPAPMSKVSPWLDLTAQPIEEVVAALDAQNHRRFIKTHTPLDGLVLDDRVSYIGVGRDPRDAAVSEFFQWDNMDLKHRQALHHAGPEAAAPDADRSLVEAFKDWMEGPIMPPDETGAVRPEGTGFRPPPRRGARPPARIGSLANILHHFGTVWERRHLPNVSMFHYADYRRDLVGELVLLARTLGCDVDGERAAELAEHATLDAMRARAAELAPNSTEKFWRSNERFFRRGGSGEWREFFTERAYRRYDDRTAELATPDLLAWAHRGRRGCSLAG